MLKRILTTILVLTILPAVLNAAAIYQNDNQSAESIRSLNRFASTEVDAAYFNPAGLAFMKNDGLYLYISDQFIFQERKITDNSISARTYYGAGNPVKFDSLMSTYSYPDLYAVWKQQNLAFYAHACFLGAGAYADYKDGSTSFNGLALQYALSMMNPTSASDIIVNPANYSAKTSLNAYMVMIGTTVGASYRATSMVSFAGGIRYVYGVQDKDFSIKYNRVGSLNTTTSTATDYTGNALFNDTRIRTVADGHACGFIGSVDVKPAEALLFAVKYEYYTPLTLENNSPKKSSGTMTYTPFLSAFQKGYKTKTPLPMSTTLGASYMITSDLKTDLSFSYYFNRLADWGKGEQGTVIAGKKINDYIDNSWAVGLAFEYAFLPNLKASLGSTYSRSGLNKKVRSDLNYSPDVVAVATGFTYGFSEYIDFTFGFMSCFFQDEKGTNFATNLGDPTANNQELTIPYTISFAFGLTYRIAM